MENSQSSHKKSAEQRELFNAENMKLIGSSKTINFNFNSKPKHRKLQRLLRRNRYELL